MNKLEKEGRFNARVEDIELGYSGNSTPQLIIDLTTEEGYISAWLYFSESAFDFSLKTLKEAFGFDGDFEKIEQIKGKDCSITVEEEEDQSGKLRLRVKWINAPRVELEEGEKQNLAQNLTKLAQSLGKKDPF